MLEKVAIEVKSIVSRELRKKEEGATLAWAGPDFGFNPTKGCSRWVDCNWPDLKLLGGGIQNLLVESRQLPAFQPHAARPCGAAY
jgi:hypothetical protein